MTGKHKIRAGFGSPIFGFTLDLFHPKIYDKRDDFDFDIVNFPFLDGDVPVLPFTVFTFLNLFDLLECLVMLLTSIHVIKS